MREKLHNLLIRWGGLECSCGGRFIAQKYTGKLFCDRCNKMKQKRRSHDYIQ